MDIDSRKLFEKIMNQPIDEKLKNLIATHLRHSFFETQCIAKDDLEIIFEELDAKKITDFQMIQIAKILKNGDVTEDFWITLKEAAVIVLHIENDVIPENLRLI